MEALLKITESNGKSVVSARELYDFLGYDLSQWSRWYKKNIISNEFAVEGDDWTGFDTVSNGNTTKDFAITLDFAKRLSMLARTIKGEEARNYFLQCEKALIENITVRLPTSKELALMVVEAEEAKERLLLQLKEVEPKRIFADAVCASPTSILIGELAKILKQNGIEMGQKRLFEWLREKGYLIKRHGSDYNIPTQKAMEKKLFEIKETSINHANGTITISKTSKVTGIGQVYFVNLFLKNKTG